MIKVKFFSSLKELVGQDEIEIALETPVSLHKIWQKTVPECTIPANTLCAINLEYVHLDDMANDNDEVAFFPPVTGG